MTQKTRLIIVLTGTAFVAVVLYILLHEAGHALAAALCGARDLKISVLHARSYWTGGASTAAAQSFCHAAGPVLPVLVSFAGMLFYFRGCKNLFYHILLPFFVLSATASLLVWVFLPLYALLRPLTNDTEDAARFLLSSGLPPGLVSLAGAVLLVLSILLAKKKRLFHVLIHSVQSGAAVSRGMALGAAGAVALAGLAVLLPELTNWLARPVVSVTVEARIPEAGTLQAFDVSEEGTYPFQIELDARGILADFRILDKEQGLLFQTMVGQGSVSGTMKLAPGTYTLSIAYLTGAEQLERHCGAMGYDFTAAEIEALSAVYTQEARLSRLLFQIK